MALAAVSLLLPLPRSMARSWAYASPPASSAICVLAWR